MYTNLSMMALKRMRLRMTEEHRTDCHAGLVAALKAKYDDQYDFMETIQGMILGEKASGWDAVVLKKDRTGISRMRSAASFLSIMCLRFRGRATVSA